MVQKVQNKIEEYILNHNIVRGPVTHTITHIQHTKNEEKMVLGVVIRWAWVRIC